ncbi:hypothetical protein KI387_019848, partial [Taxus chinensis]
RVSGYPPLKVRGEVRTRLLVPLASRRKQLEAERRVNSRTVCVGLRRCMSSDRRTLCRRAQRSPPAEDGRELYYK